MSHVGSVTGITSAGVPIISQAVLVNAGAFRPQHPLADSKLSLPASELYMLPWQQLYPCNFFVF